jgi:hypothetical protein
MICANLCFECLSSLHKSGKEQRPHNATAQKHMSLFQKEKKKEKENGYELNLITIVYPHDRQKSA